MKRRDAVPKITMEELKNAIQSLKREKTMGSDEIQNETFFIEAYKTLLVTYLKIPNKISRQQTIPPQWLEGEIKRFYKGKGVKGMCLNECRITLESNFRKLCEKIIKIWILNEINIIDAQAGRKKGRADLNHLLILKEIMTLSNNKHILYVTFLSVTPFQQFYSGFISTRLVLKRILHSYAT